MKKYKNLNESEKKSVLNKFNLLTEYSFITRQDDLLLDEDDVLFADEFDGYVINNIENYEFELPIVIEEENEFQHPCRPQDAT